MSAPSVAGMPQFPRPPWITGHRWRTVPSDRPNALCRPDIKRGFTTIGADSGTPVRDRKCHGKARFVAYFRRTQRLELHHRSQGRERDFIMNNATAEMAKKTAQKTGTREISGENTALDRRYGQIGIS